MLNRSIEHGITPAFGEVVGSLLDLNIHLYPAAVIQPPIGSERRHRGTHTKVDGSPMHRSSCVSRHIKCWLKQPAVLHVYVVNGTALKLLAARVFDAAELQTLISKGLVVVRELMRRSHGSQWPISSSQRSGRSVCMRSISVVQAMSLSTETVIPASCSQSSAP